MEIKEFISMLYQALEDKEVVKYIRDKIGQHEGKHPQQMLEKVPTNVVLENEIRRLKQTNTALEDEIRELNNKVKALEKVEERLENEKAEILEKYEVQGDKVKELNSKNAAYADKYNALEYHYNSYMALDEKIRKNLELVIKTDSIETFLCSGTQWDNLNSIWEYISHKLDSYSQEELKCLMDLFNYFFESYNQVNDLYTLLTVQEGDVLDEELHSRGSKSLVAGNISEVLLKGYKNKRTDKIIKKSIVRV